MSLPYRIFATSMVLLTILAASAPTLEGRGSGRPHWRAAGDQDAVARHVPPDYIGSWEGEGIQTDPTSSWTVQLTLAAGDMGSVVGAIAYPSLRCGGTLTLIDATADTIELLEDITYGTGTCIDEGTVVLSLTGAEAMGLTWRKEGRDTVGSADLTRISAAGGEIPVGYEGIWRGEATQDVPDSEWTILLGLNNGVVGSVAGTVGYPSLRCGGVLTLSNVTPDSIELFETLTFGSARCVDEGTISLSLVSPTELSFAWEKDGFPGTATGTLTAISSQPERFSVLGYTRDADGHAIPGVTVSAGSSRSATTDDNGAYAITGLVAGTYVITPETSDWAFSPPTHVVSLPPSASERNFTGTKCSPGQWRAAYFDNRELQEPPALVRCDEDIDFYWGTERASLGLPANDFSVRWERTLEVPETSWYRFRTFTDDGLRLYVDGERIIDDWTPRSFDERSALKKLDQGSHEIVMEYVEWAAEAMAHLTWYECPEGPDDCSLGIQPMYQTNYLDDPMPATCTSLSNQTIAAHGCLITSVAMALQAAGVETNPAELNGWLSGENPRTGTVPRGYTETCTGSLLWSTVVEFAQDRGVSLEWQATNDAVSVIRDKAVPVIMRGPGHWTLAVDVAEVDGIETLGINDPHHAWACYAVAASPPLPPASSLQCTVGGLRHATTALEETVYRGSSTPAKYLKVLEGPRTPSLQFSIEGADVLLTDSQGRRVGYDEATQEVLLEVPNSFYYDAHILPPGGALDGDIARTLYLPDDAGGRYTLDVIGGSSLAAMSAESYEISVVGFDEQFGVTERVVVGSLSDGYETRLHVDFDPGEDLDVASRRVFLPLIVRTS